MFPRDLWREWTGRDAYRPGHRFGEVTVVAGARAGKDSRIAAPIACYEAVFGGHERRLHSCSGTQIGVERTDELLPAEEIGDRW